jgi:UDP-GlcNAc:undecaprenyl-phosphate GlcNAc-1-phosphate transferase
VASIGVLSFLFVPWWGSLAFILAGLIITTSFTLAPLSKRKRMEAAAQLAETDDGGVDPVIAVLDPLDAASDQTEAGVTPSGADTDAALARLQEKEAPS